MIEEVRRIVQYKNEVAPHVQIEAGVSVSVSVAFGCTLQGVVPEDDVIWMVESCIAAGADVSGLADTTGMANCLAAYEVGIRGFGTSMGGLGGCPHAPGARRQRQRGDRRPGVHV